MLGYIKRTSTPIVLTKIKIANIVLYYSKVIKQFLLIVNFTDSNTQKNIYFDINKIHTVLSHYQNITKTVIIV